MGVIHTTAGYERGEDENNRLRLHSKTLHCSLSWIQKLIEVFQLRPATCRALQLVTDYCRATPGSEEFEWIIAEESYKRTHPEAENGAGSGRSWSCSTAWHRLRQSIYRKHVSLYSA